MPLTLEAVELTLHKALEQAPFPGAGSDVDVYGRLGGSDKYVRVQIHSGTGRGEAFIDYCNVDFGEDGFCVDSEQFRRSVAAVRPFEAFLAELDNEEALDAYTRQQRIAGFETPAIIRSLHYLDETMVSRLGGIARLRNCPVSKVEEFLGGAIIELVEGAFDPMNPAHLEVQRETMRFLGLPER